MDDCCKNRTHWRAGTARFALRRAASERGFTLVELLVAVLVMSLGVAATIRVFAASGSSTVSTQRHEVAVQQAQAEIDRLSVLEYGGLALTTAPPASSNPNDPGYRVSGTNLRVRSDLSEPLVLAPGTGQTAKVAPGPEPFTVASGTSAITGKVYRFVTWRDENCPNSLCDGTQNTKRITVAITLDASGAKAARAPVWVSSVLADPETVPPGSTPPPRDNPTVTAQSFYLYDTPCGETQRQPQTDSHSTHNTASSGSAPRSNSFCENGDSSMQPDLMDPSLPDGPASTPLYSYSSDLSGNYPGGLAMMREGSSCSSSYAEPGANTGAPNKWSTHAWSTNPFASAFRLNGQVTVSLFTTSVGAAAGRGVICASLIDRQLAGGAPQDRALGSFVFDVAQWPTTPRRLTFTFKLSQVEDVAANHRLVLALHLRGDSDHDVALLYDHPSFPSLLEVATPTPLSPE